MSIMLSSSSTYDLILHSGKAPFWLLNRMKKLAEPIVSLIISEFGELELLKRLSDPIFFQSFSNVLGFDWNSSGSTTVLTSVLKSFLNEKYSIKIAGGKGDRALKTPEEIRRLSVEVSADPEKLIKFSRFAAKADNAALIDGYNIYHHVVLFTDKYFTVIQQGMNEKLGLARRYHWKVYKNLPGIEEVHSGIVSDRIESSVINMQSKLSRDARKVCLEVVCDGRFKKDYEKIPKNLAPKKIDWKAIEKAYNLQPERFEDLLMIRGVGRETVRALALIAELVYCVDYDKKDPVKYCFAVGGKDGVPFPVRRDVYDEVIAFMRDAVKRSDLSSYEKVSILRRLEKWMSS
ncbi:MAG: DUF763 domain-containing protein [Archaeoglobaceae archaeon]|nr:DUF763 domain-containing protein [Archaeoglobaceae archaeon]